MRRRLALAKKRDDRIFVGTDHVVECAIANSRRSSQATADSGRCSQATAVDPKVTATLLGLCKNFGCYCHRSSFT
jgi:hypothetical protein